MTNFSSSSGTAYGAKRAFEDFGLTDVSVRFAMFSGDCSDRGLLDKTKEMIRYCKPVVLCAFDPVWAEGRCCGHTIIIDGYKSDETGIYMHINWGWNGWDDGYFPWGVFKTTARTGYEIGVDSGVTSEVNNFCLFHYYVFYEN